MPRPAVIKNYAGSFTRMLSNLKDTEACKSIVPQDTKACNSIVPKVVTTAVEPNMSALKSGVVSSLNMFLAAKESIDPKKGLSLAKIKEQNNPLDIEAYCSAKGCGE